ncbi:MAG: cytochrome c [Paracoccaceae bacterium]|nr:cytochrome c [Paracoccaceae bacterium]
MNRIAKPLTLVLILAAGIAVAKPGVKDPGVKLRMETMDRMALNLKMLGQMSKGLMDFNVDDATAAKASIVAAAKDIPTVFKVHHTDPASDALPAIWTNWDDFAKKAAAARMAAELIDTSTQDGIQMSLGQIATACKACHTTYRR